LFVAVECFLFKIIVLINYIRLAYVLMLWNYIYMPDDGQQERPKYVALLIKK